MNKLQKNKQVKFNFTFERSKVQECEVMMYSVSGAVDQEQHKGSSKHLPLLLCISYLGDSIHNCCEDVLLPLKNTHTRRGLQWIHKSPVTAVWTTGTSNIAYCKHLNFLSTYGRSARQPRVDMNNSRTHVGLLCQLNYQTQFIQINGEHIR